ncbi:Imm3 family immunity protein [Bacillus sp. FJAT-51639]|uniref:Imm3 family immunity protein n=1 Tax=Bacillus bruguierae TaxID=3127667 RepID=A0ABU8FL57_9BACI
MALTYEEIFEYFNETYNDFKEDEKIDSEEAIERTFGEYETVLNQSESKKAIVYTAYGELLISLPKIYRNSKNNLVETLKHLNSDLIQQELTRDQYVGLFSRIGKILHEIEEKRLYD